MDKQLVGMSDWDIALLMYECSYSMDESDIELRRLCQEELERRLKDEEERAS
jgi:hypothetical protein